MDPNEVRQGLLKVPFGQVGQQAPSPLMEDVGALLPSRVARASQQPAVTPEQAVGEQIWNVGGVACLAFASQARACATISERGRQSVEANASISAASCSGVTCCSLRTLRNWAPASGGRPRPASKLLGHAAVDGATDIAGLEQLVRLEQLAHRVVADARQPRGDGQEWGSGHLGLDRPQAPEQLHDRRGTTPGNRWKLPAQRPQPQLIVAEPAHGSDVNRIV